MIEVSYEERDVWCIACKWVGQVCNLVKHDNRGDPTKKAHGLCCPNCESMDWCFMYPSADEVQLDQALDLPPGFVEPPPVGPLREMDTAFTFTINQGGLDREVLRISRDGFFVEGRPVPIDDLREHDQIIYGALKKGFNRQLEETEKKVRHLEGLREVIGGILASAGRDALNKFAGRRYLSNDDWATALRLASRDD